MVPAHGRITRRIVPSAPSIVVEAGDILCGAARRTDAGRRVVVVGISERDAEQQLAGFAPQPQGLAHSRRIRSEEHTSELQSLMRISYAVFCLKKKNKRQHT